MKKHILSFALVATMIGSIAAGCSSVNETVSSDSAVVDSTTVPDTVIKADTMRTDSVKP